jgi:hypothetical protein
MIDWKTGSILFAYIAYYQISYQRFMLVKYKEFVKVITL